MENSIMKMAFVINGALSKGFDSSIQRATRKIADLKNEVKKINEIRDSVKKGNMDRILSDATAKKLDDAYAGRIKSIETEKDKVRDLMKARTKSLANFSSAKLNFLSTLQTAQTITGPLVDAYDVASNFEKAMSKVGAISLGDLKGDEYKRQLELLTKTARELGEKTQFTATQSAEAMSYLGMAGWKTEQIIQGMPHLLSLAVAGGTDLARTADILSDNLTAFGLSADKSQHMADVYATIITNTNTNVEMLGETMKYCAPIASAFGASMEETAAMAGVMANSGIKASQAGTTLRSGLIRLAGPPKMAQKALDELGLSMEDMVAEEKQAAMALKSLGIETGNLTGPRKMAVILDNLREKSKDLSKEQKVAMMGAIFGKNAAPGWVKMIDSAPGSFEKLVDSLYNCEGAAARMEKRMNANTKGAAMRMKSAFESLQISLMNGFLPSIASAFEWAARNLSAASRLAAEYPVLTKSILGTVGAISALVVAFSATNLIYRAGLYAKDGFNLWQDGITHCIKMLDKQIGVTKALGNAATFVFGKIGTLFKTISAFITGLPIGWVLLGIAALVVAGTLLYKHWDKVKAFFTELWESPKARLLMFVTGPIGWLVGAVTAIIANWDTLKAYFEYFWDNPGAALFRFQNWVQESFQNAVKAGEQKWNELKAWLDKPIFATFIAPAWENFKSSAVEAFENVRAKAGAAFDGVKATISVAVDSAVETVMNLPGDIAYAIGYAAGFMYETLTQLPGKISTLVTQAGQFLLNLPEVCLNAGVTFVNNLATWTTQAWNTIVDFFTRAITDAWDKLMMLPDICYEAGAAFINRLTTWGSEAFGAMFTFLVELNKAFYTFLFNLPTICMNAGQRFVSAAAQWAQDAYNSIMEWITKLPEAISNTISNAWENIKSKFSSGFTVGVSAAQNTPVAANAKGGIYNRGAFLTTFAEKSPEAAIPIDNSDRAKGLWLRVGRMLGMVQQSQGRSVTPAMEVLNSFSEQTGYDQKPILPNIPLLAPVINAMATAPATLFNPVIQPADMPDMNFPEISAPKETLIERIREITSAPAQGRQDAPAPAVTIHNEFHFSGQVDQREVRETVDRSTDISMAKFRDLMLQWQREQRRVQYE